MENFYKKTSSMRSLMDEKLNEMDKIFEITKIFSESFDSHSNNLQEMILSLLEHDYSKKDYTKEHLNFIKKKELTKSCKTIDEKYLLYNQKKLLRKQSNKKYKAILNFEDTNFSTVEKFREKKTQNFIKKEQKYYDGETLKNEEIFVKEKTEFTDILKDQNNNMTKLLESGQENSKILREMFNNMFDSFLKFQNSNKDFKDFEEIKKKKRFYKEEMIKYKKLYMEGKIENEINKGKVNLEFGKQIEILKNDNFKNNFNIENLVANNSNLQKENIELKKNLIFYIKQIDELKNIINDYKFDFKILKHNINFKMEKKNDHYPIQNIPQNLNTFPFENMQNNENQKINKFSNNNNKNFNSFSKMEYQKTNNFPNNHNLYEKNNNNLNITNNTEKNIQFPENNNSEKTNFSNNNNFSEKTNFTNTQNVQESDDLINNYKLAINQRNQLISIIKSLPDSNLSTSTNTENTSPLNFCSFNNSENKFIDSENTIKEEKMEIKVIGLKDSIQKSELSSFDCESENIFKKDLELKNSRRNLENSCENSGKNISFLTLIEKRAKIENEKSGHKKKIFEDEKNVFEETLQIFPKKRDKDEESSYSYVNISEDFSIVSNSIQKNKGRDSVTISVENNRETEKKIFKSERELPLDQPKICKFNVYGNIKKVSKSLQMEDLNELLEVQGGKFAKDVLLENFSSFNKDG